MGEGIEIVTIDAGNVDKLGFFCYKSKPKAAGYHQKLHWLRQRFAEGMRIKILYEGNRSVGFMEYVPGDACWRAVRAPGYLLVHCMWVVGRAKGKGYGQRLLDACIQDAQQSGAKGVAAVTSDRVWLSGRGVFLKAGFEVVDRAPPSFELVMHRFADAPLPSFPTDWADRRERYGRGLTIIRTDQCPYVEDATRGVVELARKHGVEARIVRLAEAQEVQSYAPSAYGVCEVVYDGHLLSHHYLGRRQRETLVKLFTLAR